MLVQLNSLVPNQNINNLRAARDQKGPSDGTRLVEDCLCSFKVRQRQGKRKHKENAVLESEAPAAKYKERVSDKEE